MNVSILIGQLRFRSFSDFNHNLLRWKTLHQRFCISISVSRQNATFLPCFNISSFSLNFVQRGLQTATSVFRSLNNLPIEYFQLSDMIGRVHCRLGERVSCKKPRGMWFQNKAIISVKHFMEFIYGVGQFNLQYSFSKIIDSTTYCINSFS